MTDSPARILAEHLIVEEYLSHPETNDSWPVFVGMMPDAEVSDVCASVYDTTPVKAFRMISGEGTKWNWGIQIRFRCMDYSTGWDKASSISSFLDSITRETVQVGANNYTIDTFVVESPVLSLGKEEGTERLLFTLNGIIWLIEE